MKVQLVRDQPPPTPSANQWPEPARGEAFQGVIGEFIESINGKTEADKHAILLHALPMFANIVGRKPFFYVAETRHYLTQYVVVVGQTSAGRKGMSRDLALSIMKHADGTWPGIISGLSSGEGLIHVVRDPQAKAAVKPAKSKKDHKAVPLLDPGVTDKRAMVIETEFASVLQIMKRPGNILSPILRDAWDGSKLQVASRNTAATATDAHICVVGHITLKELRQSLDDVSYFNGFANRFVWPVSKRAAVLPEGERIDRSALETFSVRLVGIVADARRVGEMRRSEKATRLWRSEYERLTSPQDNLVGAVTARAAPYVMRFACCYALLDKSAIVQVQHLRSALALWEYCEASARYIFGDLPVDQTSNRILRELRERFGNGLTRTEIFDDVFKRHQSREDIARALDVLRSNGKARFEIRKTKGRPEEKWFAK